MKPVNASAQRRAMRENAKRLIEAAERTRPSWASLPPWLAEQFIEPDKAPRKQRTLFDCTEAR